MFQDLVRRNIAVGLALYQTILEAPGGLVPVSMTRIRQQVQLDNFQDGPHATTLLDADKRYLPGVYPVQFVYGLLKRGDVVYAVCPTEWN